jgi:hypothetical protein
MRVPTLRQLSKLGGCAADVFADRTGHASELGFTVGARLSQFAWVFCRQGRTGADGLDTSKEFVCTVL